MRVLIDTDPGVDDAVALGMVLKRADVEVLGVVCASGNVGIEQSVENTLKILQAFDRFDVPVYQGASSAIIANDINASYYHGKDGLADALDYKPCTSQLQKEHGVHAINRLCKLYPGEIIMICLGPLTNLALALRMNSQLSFLLKEVVIMGGNYQGHGNITFAAEFNFHCDPTAAYILLKELSCPKVLVTWEVTKEPHITNNDIETYIGYGTKSSDFMRKIFQGHLKQRGAYCLAICDAVAMAVALNRSIVTKSHHVFGTVELHGEMTKGLCVYDWLKRTDNEPNLTVVDAFDVEKYRELVLSSTK